MTTVALRTALIWHDEVMDDVVVHKPTQITVGNDGQADVRRAERRAAEELRDRAPGQPRLSADARRADARHDLPRRRARRTSPSSSRGGEGAAASARRRSAARTGASSISTRPATTSCSSSSFPSRTRSRSSRSRSVAGLGGYLISMLALAIVFFDGRHVDFTMLGSAYSPSSPSACSAAGARDDRARPRRHRFAGSYEQEGDQQASFAFACCSTPRSCS